ncbi:Ig-like domain-containing protein [Legionella lytica]|uniref:Ig-like domain-containing protein n=1 Tax=Legionella lytica TaxID=96232 RepID=A0ABW8D7I0_9GAMM
MSFARLCRQIVASILIYSQVLQIAIAAPLLTALPAQQGKPTTNSPTMSAGPLTPLLNATQTGKLNNLSLSNQQLGFYSPLNFGVNYSDLTGTFFNAHYVLPLGEKLAIGALGEYGAGQYRFNGTLGYGFTPSSQMKFTAERLGQRLPFQFDSGDIRARVSQDAYGLRFQQLLNLALFQGVNAGGYYAQADNKDLNPVIFTSDGNNCAGYRAGLQCINYRHIAGARSMGLDAGVNLLLTPTTFVNGNLYYDQVHYNPLFSSTSNKDRNGIGAGVKINQLLNEHFKLNGEATAREIYNTYQAGLSWLPNPHKTKLAWELSVIGQHITSHNATPDNNSISLQINFLADNNKRYQKQELLGQQNLNDIAQWVSAPAVKMNQVLVIAEQVTKLLAPTITGINPSNGPFAGGNVVTITGSNFIPGLLLYFGSQLATNVQILSPTQIQATVPASSAPFTASNPVNLMIQNPDGQQALLPNGYTYISAALPTITTISPNQGSNAGGETVVISGTNFAGASVTIGGAAATIVSINDTQITILTPALPSTAGPVNVVITTPQGSITSSGGFTYLATPPQPTGLTIPPGGASLSGNGVAGDTIIVTDAAGVQVGTGVVQSDGTFNIILNPAQNNGQILTVVQSNGTNSSAPVTITAPNESAPNPPTALNVSSDGTTLTGQGEAGTTVTVTDPSGNVIGTGLVPSTGGFSIPLNPPQVNGEILTVVLTNGSGNSSSPVTVQAPDVTPPAPPTDLFFNSNGTTLSGNGEAGTTATVTNASGVVLGSAVVSAAGSFTVNLTPPQTNGEILTVVLTNSNGDSSTPVEVQAPDITAPAAPTNLLVNNNGTELSGNGEAGTTATVTDASGVVLGSAVVGAAGTFTITFTTPQINGELLSVFLTDNVGNVSPTVTIQAPDITPPAPPTNLVIYNNGTELSGNGEAGTTATVTDASGVVLGSAVVGAAGTFTITFTTPQINGELLSVFLTDNVGNVSPTVTIQAPDITPPAPPTNLVIYNNGTELSGNGEAGNTITVTNGGNPIGTAIVDVNGDFVVALSPPATSGETLQVTSTDEAGNVSIPASVTALAPQST